MLAPLGEGVPVKRSPMKRRRAAPRRGAFRSKVLLEVVRLMPCAFCQRRPPVNAHHVPPRSVLGGVDDRLACPACGSGTTGCHGEAHAGRIPMVDQLAAVGRTMALHLLALRMTPAEAEEAIGRVPRLDWQAVIRDAMRRPSLTPPPVQW